VITALLLQRALYMLFSNKFNISFFRSDNLILIAFLVPLVAIAISSIASINKTVSFLEIRTLSILSLRCLIIIFFSSAEDIKIFIKSIYYVTAFAIAFAIYQYIGDLAGLSGKLTLLIKNYSSRGDYLFPRIHSLSHEPLYFANYLLISLGLISGELYLNKQKSSKWLKLLFVLSTGIIILTVARGAIYGLLLGLLTLVIITRDKKFIKEILIYCFISIIFSLAMLGSASLFKNQLILDDFGSHAAATTDGSVLNRTSTWKYATKAFKSSPIIGVGGSNSQYYIGENSPIENNNNSKNLSKIIVFNNTFLTYAAEYGLLGLLSIMPMLILVFIIFKNTFFEKPRSYLVGLVAFLIAIILQALTFEMFLVMRFWMLLALLITIYRIRLSNKASLL
jgi:hypothetical protein